jgi:hypothetical protein
METTHSFQSCARDRPPSLLPHCVGWVSVVGIRDQPPFVASGTSHGSGGEKAEAPSTPRIIPSMNFWVVASALFHGINSGVPNRPPDPSNL